MVKLEQQLLRAGLKSIIDEDLAIGKTGWRDNQQLPLGKVCIVASLEGSEQTPEAVVIHDFTLKPYDNPGNKFGTSHSSAVGLQLTGVAW